MRILLPILSALLFAGCTNLLDADLTNRSTFVKLFNGIQGIEATACEKTAEGYIVLGNMPITIDSVITVVFTTNKQGNRTSDLRYYQGGSGKAIKAVSSGYLIIGDHLKLEQAPSGLVGIYSTRMLLINSDLDSITTTYLRDPSPNFFRVSYRGTSLTVDQTTNKVVILGTYQTSLDAPEKPYVQIFNNDLQTQQWYYEFDLIDKDYRLAKTVHYNNGEIIWAGSIAQEQQNFDLSYVCIPNVLEGQVFKNFSIVGASSDQKFQPYDIQPANSPDFGFGVVGTRSNTNGGFSNMFFLRTDINGTIIQSSVTYYDASISGRNEEVQLTCTDPLTPTLPAFPCSEIQDYGTALASTSDGGYVLAGHFETTDSGDDILLIKVNAIGSVLWIKTIGGNGSEQVSTVLETEDQGLLLCGTNVVGNVPSIFLIKTDKNGELKN